MKEGKDPEFGRILTYNNGLDVSKGPFYGIECCPKIHHTMGGVMINPKAQVISAATHEPIKGLYAGGNHWWCAWRLALGDRGRDRCFDFRHDRW